MKRAKTSTAMPFPARPADEVHGLLFWLTVWLREQARFEALEAHYEAIVKRRSTLKNPALTSAICAALRLLEAETEATFGQVMKFGGLLFAWHGTTALQLLQAQPEAVPA